MPIIFMFSQKIVKLEVHLEHIRMMQIKANISRMKYRAMCSDLKEKSVLYASSLKNLEDEIREQESEMKRLQVSHRFSHKKNVCFVTKIVKFL